MTARGASAEARLERNRFGADFWGAQVFAAFAASDGERPLTPPQLAPIH